jgi:DNA-binding response OmpR family regulator
LHDLCYLVTPNDIPFIMSDKRILVIDDEPNISSLLQHYLAQMGGYEVLTENFPAHAQASARAFNPDMILLDVNMPGKDGGEVASEFRADPAFSHVPILFLTSLVSSAEAGKREITRGSRRFLAKPVNPEVLLSVVARMLKEACSSTY